MSNLKSFYLLCILLPCFIFCDAQIEATHISLKDYKAFGFGSFLNFSVPVSDADFITAEGGLLYFNKDQEEVGLFPVLAGYRYTFDRSGTGFFVEPNAGYCFGSSTIAVYDTYDSPVYENGKQLYRKVAGPAAGVSVGYLFEPSGRIQFNLAFRYEHSFASAQPNIFSFRISHAFTFGRRERY